ncbi:DUF423 domain-containing protein [Aestuariibacter salexigens]|uniref:DUF423 domain-containing protein n=1 Tax=Aestuariibacter salexigens TaxID=226010 RepID=UPI000422C75A|nr:DUF423 domain-containing protein [Aestuariibacter salexigens]
MKLLTIFAAISGMTAVILGAFAAHGLKGKLSEPLLNAFQTGVQYQFYHTLALLFIVLISRFVPSTLLSWSGYFFAAGILLFSGSLYLLALTGIKWFGPITPLGGVCFIAGWAMMLVVAIKEL